jgi:hypothetical protein
MKTDQNKFGRITSLIGAVVLLTIAVSCAPAETADGPAAVGTGEMAVPRLSDGKPDFSGVWDHPRVGDITRDGEGCAAGHEGCAQVGSGPLQFTAEGQTVRDQNDAEGYYDYGAHCMPWGFMRAYGTPYPHAYVHSPDRLTILWEQDNAWHMVPTYEGVDFPADMEPTWRGTSIGRWDGDTLVIETRGFNGQTWLDTARNPMSEEMVQTVRLSRPDYNHLNFDVTIEDPRYYSAPIANSRVFVLMDPGEELYEYSCSENNRCEGGNCTPADVQLNN